ncbi:hypothetical protein MML48_6g00009351 [Holotrichia oblita]|uniref:Uncharacterized protein n=1 Tax=Holotrichia oblita TaxID=644536 RepID=A0ACB9T0C5_HOLOL|nr:hypothetical protein MML48_6g00009351 [Holotrichia oblita]
MEFDLVCCVLVTIFLNRANIAECKNSLANLKITKMQMCDPSVNYPLMMTNEIRTEGDKQYLSGKGDFKIDFGADSEYKMTANIKKTRETAEFSPLLTFDEPDTCAAIKKYLGFQNNFYLIESNINFDFVLQGTYEVKDYLLDFTKISYQAVPEGILQVTQIITNKNTKEMNNVDKCRTILKILNLEKKRGRPFFNDFFNIKGLELVPPVRRNQTGMEPKQVVTILFLIGGIARGEDVPETFPFKIIEMGMCDPKIEYPMMLNYKITEKNGKQYLTGKSNLKVDFGQDSDFNVTVFLKRTDEEEFAQLMTVYEEDTCSAMYKYIGDMVDDMEKAVNIKPGTCPVPKGTYGLNEYYLDLSQIPLNFIPEGIIRTIFTITNKNTKEVLLCYSTEIENLPG